MDLPIHANVLPLPGPHRRVCRPQPRSGAGPWTPRHPHYLDCAFSPQIEEQLRKAEEKVGKKALKESDYLEVLERSCSQDWER